MWSLSTWQRDRKRSHLSHDPRPPTVISLERLPCTQYGQRIGSASDMGERDKGTLTPFARSSFWSQGASLTLSFSVLRCKLFPRTNDCKSLLAQVVWQPLPQPTGLICQRLAMHARSRHGYSPHRGDSGNFPATTSNFKLLRGSAAPTSLLRNARTIATKRP